MSATIYTPPTGWPPSSGPRSSRKYLFLAGTIEMGNSPDWQSQVIKTLQDYDISIFNPRRVIPPEDDKSIIEQINWELDALSICKTVYMYLAADTISPISLYELGLLQGHAGNQNIIVYCDPAYTRKLNVLTTTTHPYWKSHNVTVFQDFSASILELKRYLDHVTFR